MSDALIDRARHGQSLADELVIDAHAHIGPYPSFYIPYNTAADMVHEMDRIGIRLCWAFPFMFGADWRMANDDVLAALKAYPDRFWGFLTLSPHFPDDSVPELERCLAGGCVGVKLHPDMHQYDPNTVDLDNMLSYLNRYGLICHSHNFGSEATMERLLTGYPQVTFVASHFAVHYGELVKRYDNLYVCAATAWGMRSLEQFVADVGAERVLMGTDFPCLDVATGIGPVLYADLADEQKRLILGLNAQKIMERINSNAQHWRSEHS